MNCPVCDKPLHAGDFGEAPVHMCPECMGVVVGQGKLIPLMDELSKDLVKSIDFDHPIEKAEQSLAFVCCPRCFGNMEAFGYMETNLVKAFRCSKDWLVFADTEALGVMSVLYARTKLRRETREAAQLAEFESLNNRVALMIKNRVRSNMVAGGVLLGFGG